MGKAGWRFPARGPRATGTGHLPRPGRARPDAVRAKPVSSNEAAIQRLRSASHEHASTLCRSTHQSIRPKCAAASRRESLRSVARLSSGAKCRHANPEPGRYLRRADRPGARHRSRTGLSSRPAHSLRTLRAGSPWRALRAALRPTIFRDVRMRIRLAEVGRVGPRPAWVCRLLSVPTGVAGPWPTSS